MRIKRGVTAHKKHQKLRKATKGMSGIRQSSPRMARQAMYKALSYQYRDRRNRKRDFRQLWVTRINAASRANGLSYSKFIKLLKDANIELDRKVLSELAVKQPEAFKAIAETVKNAK